MRIVVASDHAGFALKEHVKATLDAGGHQVTDVGTTSAESTDYPSYAAAAARAVAAGEAERAVVVCGSGNGVTITANKIDGIRAVNAHDAEEASMARLHNGINVLGLSQARITPEAAGPIVEAFLATGFEGGRHERRIDEIADVERGGPGTPPATA
ncbi:Ribose 5-phosphate isomerase B [Patulibacter medicamentivorans]|uniref:Ribose 5-phosphate isomerase B n=1 Tax=Patulibacter medicamentivorans TaxID=1097667 RepID=H0E4G4_9ACTN|nr:ribose 5-phosphate isomerase B [Patulibacter medicamentivorans]EHN11416.1 Ribose 5-phosphate isomerase B [Patulibacter medicamentivorans]